MCDTNVTYVNLYKKSIFRNYFFYLLVFELFRFLCTLLLIFFLGDRTHDIRGRGGTKKMLNASLCLMHDTNTRKVSKIMSNNKNERKPLKVSFNKGSS